MQKALRSLGIWVNF